MLLRERTNTNKKELEEHYSRYIANLDGELTVTLSDSELDGLGNWTTRKAANNHNKHIATIQCEFPVTVSESTVEALGNWTTRKALNKQKTLKKSKGNGQK